MLKKAGNSFHLSLSNHYLAMHFYIISRLFFYLLPAVCFSQIVDDVVMLKYSIPSASLSRVMDEHEMKVIGTPYKNTTYEIGSVTTFNIKKDSLLLRYNAYRDQFEILDNSRSTTYLRKDESSHVELDSLQYLFRRFFAAGKEWSGYLNPLNEGNTILYRRHIKTAQIRFPDNGYDQMRPPEFEDITEYFIKREGKPADRLHSLSRKEVFAILWDKYSELRKYARKRKLHMRNEKEVIEVLAYYASIKNSDDDLDEIEK